MYHISCVTFIPLTLVFFYSVVIKLLVRPLKNVKNVKKFTCCAPPVPVNLVCVEGTTVSPFTLSLVKDIHVSVAVPYLLEGYHPGPHVRHTYGRVVNSPHDHTVGPVRHPC